MGSLPGTSINSRSSSPGARWKNFARYMRPPNAPPASGRHVSVACSQRLVHGRPKRSRAKWVPVRVKKTRWKMTLALFQALVLHAPEQQVDAVLAEERLVLEHEGRHAPMT